MVVSAALRSLRARRGLLLAAVAVAAALAIVANYSVGLLPPSLKAPGQRSASAAITLYIDTQRSALANANIDPTALATRAPQYAALASSVDVVRRAAAIAGQPSGSFSVTAQQLTRAGANVIGQSGGGGVGAVTVSAGDAPSLDVATTAATRERARALTLGVARALSEAIDRAGESDDLSPSARIELRTLGQPRVSETVPTVSAGRVAVTWIVVWLVLAALILAADLVRAAGRGRRQQPAVSD